MLLYLFLICLAHEVWASPGARQPQLLDTFTFFSTASPPPTPTIPHKYGNNHGLLLPRASSVSTSATPSSSSSPTLVDLYSMPTCLAASYCIETSSLKLPCPVVDIPCPPNVTDTTCTTYTTECYCSLVTPLSCAWICPSWFTWLQDEDWFASTCPSVPPVDFSALPDCASDCVETGSIDYGCITGGRNCFCLHNSLFNCPGGCSLDDQDKIATWYENECNVTTDDATAVVQGSRLPTTSAVILKASAKGKNLHWYEIFVIVVAASSFSALAIGALVWR